MAANDSAWRTAISIASASSSTKSARIFSKRELRHRSGAACQNVDEAHLVTAIASSERQGTFDREDGVFGSSVAWIFHPMEGKFPLGADEYYWLLCFRGGDSSAFSLATKLIYLIWPLPAPHWNGTEPMAGVMVFSEIRALNPIAAEGNIGGWLLN